MARRLISVIIPFYNEAENLEPVYRAVQKVADILPYDFEFIFVDDGSRDDSVAFGTIFVSEIRFTTL